MSGEELARRLRTIFASEMEDQLRVMNDDLLFLEHEPSDAERLRSLFRVAHTLKGAASAAHVPLVAAVCHELEAMLSRAREGDIVLGEPEFKILFAAATVLEQSGRRLKESGDVDAAALRALQANLAELDAGVEEKRLPAPAVQAAVAAPSYTPQHDPAPRTPASADRHRASDHIRVETARVDSIVAAMSQLSIAADGASARLNEARELDVFAREALATATAQQQRKRPQHRTDEQRPGYDGGPLQQVRELAQRVALFATQASVACKTLDSSTRELVGQTMALRMRPFAEATEALPRVVRDLSMEQRKQVRLELLGGDVHADRVVIDGLREAMLHLVRNAVDHGIEAPELRPERNKLAEATISITAALAGDLLVVTVSDDGAGLDMPAIRQRVAELGKAVPADDQSTIALLFQGGISTRSTASEISGRGVGLDLVRDAIERIHGVVSANSTPGAGTTFRIECPVSLASTRAIIVGVGSQRFAIPVAQVERLQLVKLPRLTRAGGQTVLADDAEPPGPPIPAATLARLLGPPLADRPLADRSPAVIVTNNGKRVALFVDELIGEQEITVRPVRTMGKTLPVISGATILHGGRVVLALNTASLVTRAFNEGAADTQPRLPSQDAPRRARILVVDDSITTRTLEQGVLEAAGYDVSTAVDGAAAWEMLRETPFDLVLADIEMPRMDGFALCRAIRGEKQLESIPVVLITSLETSADRARGLEAGADAYIAKSSFDQRALLDAIDRLIG